MSLRVCAYSCTCSQVHTYMWRLTLGRFLYHSPPCLFRHGLPLLLSSQIQPIWPVTSRIPLSLGLQAPPPHLAFLPPVLGIQTQITQKHFPDRSVSLAPQPQRVTFQLSHINRNVWQHLPVSDLFQFLQSLPWAANGRTQSLHDDSPLHSCTTICYLFTCIYVTLCHGYCEHCHSKHKGRCLFHIFASCLQAACLLSVTVIKTSTNKKKPWRVKGLFGLKIQITLHHGGKPEREPKQGRKLELGTEAESMGECCLLAYCSWLIQHVLLYCVTTHRGLDLPMSRKCPPDLPRPDADGFSVDVLSFCMLLYGVGVRFIKTQPVQTMSPVGLLSYVTVLCQFSEKLHTISHKV